MSEDSTVPFLLVDEREKDEFTERQRDQTPEWRRRWPSRTTAILHASLIAFYTAVFLLTTYSQHAKRCDSLVWSPALAAIKWEVRSVDGFRPDEIYTHIPSPEVDLAWSKLLNNTHFRIYPSEMARLGLDSLPLADGSGYLGSLGMYHQLHCLKRIQRWMYRDYYYRTMSEWEEKDTFDHMAHCVELLRQASVCRADTSITTFRWLESEVDAGVVRASPKMGMRHECVSWNELQGWIEPRRLDLYDEEVLGKPPIL